MFDEVMFFHDGVLAHNDAVKLSDRFHADKEWRSGWRSNRNLSDWHFHRSIWQDKDNMPEMMDNRMDEEPDIKELWGNVNEQLMKVYKQSFRPIRAYANAHTYGLDGQLHIDDGDVTAIYYPAQDWDPEWEGGTGLFTEDGDCIKYCRYKFNRMIAFPAKTLHKAMPLSKNCGRLRTVITFKCIVDVNHELYTRWYSETS
jgi:SM-20-related protein